MDKNFLSSRKTRTWKDCLHREHEAKGEARKMDENAKIIDDPSAFVSVDHAKGGTLSKKHEKKR